ncbi:MAG TPA: hypothetical protein VEA37_08115 [Flavobacterium sp.]|nr:hypothetical protein [Flavobacterium sp.]
MPPNKKHEVQKPSQRCTTFGLKMQSIKKIRAIRNVCDYVGDYNSKFSGTYFCQG